MPSSYSLVTKGLPDNSFDHVDEVKIELWGPRLGIIIGLESTSVQDHIVPKLSNLILWPECEELMKTMPTVFKKQFKRCAVIIDCYEIFID